MLHYQDSISLRQVSEISVSIAEIVLLKAVPPFPDVPEVTANADQHSFQRQAAAFFRDQKKMLRRRQIAMHKAREEWNRNAEMLASIEPSTARDDMVTRLKQECSDFSCSTSLVDNFGNTGECPQSRLWESFFKTAGASDPGSPGAAVE